MTAVMEPEAVLKHRKRVAWALFITAMVLVLGWPVAIWANWEHIVSSHARLGYLIGDVGLVSPLCFAAWRGLLRDRLWGPTLFLVADGAMAYDVLHFAVYLIQEKFLSIPMPVYVILLLIVLGILYWLARWEIVVLSRDSSRSA